jgi:DNA-binding IclR family transcriptional regulator
MEHDADTPPVEATMTSMRILGALNEHATGVTELATKLGMHKSTVYKHLSTLERTGYVTNDDGYRLDTRLLQLGETAKHQHGFYDRIRPVIDQLAETTEEFVGFSIESGDRVYDIYTARGRLALREERSPVTADQFHCSAAGKAILAQFPEERLREYIQSEDLSPMTDRTITDPETLLETIKLVREREIAIDREEQRTGFRSVAAPYREESLHLYGAMYVSGPVDRMTGKRFEEDIPGMIHGAIENIRKDRS